MRTGYVEIDFIRQISFNYLQNQKMRYSFLFKLQFFHSFVLKRTNKAFSDFAK